MINEDKKIAVDCVLLPSEQMTEKAIEANKELLKNNPPEIVLDKKNCLPHISLAMGCVYQKDLPAIESILQSIAKQYSFGELRVLGLHIGVNSIGQKISAVTIDKTKQLQSLHEMVMEKLAPFTSYDVSEDMLFPDAKIAESTLLWVKTYREKSSFAWFFPHITIGYGQLHDFDIPPTFSISKLALCQLGNHCTCRKILISMEFKN